VSISHSSEVPLPKKPPKIRSGAAACIALAITAGCAAGPDYVRPQVNAGPAFVEASDSAGPGRRWNDAAARSNWWILFANPKLVWLRMLVPLGAASNKRSKVVS